MADTLGVRLNNPGNLEWGSPWEGLVPRQLSRYFNSGTSQQQRFCEFEDAAYGIRAIARTLITYYDKRKALDGSKIDTIREVVERWAPAHENNVGAYANHVSQLMNSNADEIINIKDYDVMRGLVKGIIAHENSGFEYPDQVLDEGLRRAGVVRRTASATLPASTESVAGAAVPAVVGVTQLGEVLPDVIGALNDQQENIASGDTVRVIIGLVLVIAGAAVAYSQYKRRKAGAA